MNWQEVLPEVYLYRDSCNVYAVRGPDGMLIVDASLPPRRVVLNFSAAPALLSQHTNTDPGPSAWS